MAWTALSLLLPFVFVGVLRWLIKFPVRGPSFSDSPFDGT
jgi:hypothetical protein